MALDLNGTSHYATAPTAAVNLETGTFSIWLLPDFAPSAATIRFLFDTDGARHAVYTSLNGLTVYVDGRSVIHDTTGLWSAGSWTHFAAGYDKGTDTRKLWINGSLITPGTPVGTWGSTALGTNFYVGRRFASTFYYLDADVAEVATYSVLLSNGEVAALAKGFSPLVVSRGLRAYWPLVRTGVPRFGGNEITPQGGPSYSSHPRIIMPHRRGIRRFTTAAAGGGFQSRRYYDSLIGGVHV